MSRLFEAMLKEGVDWAASRVASLRSCFGAGRLVGMVKPGPGKCNGVVSAHQQASALLGLLGAACGGGQGAGRLTKTACLPEQGGPVIHGLSGAVDAFMRPARKYHLAGRVGLVGSPADQAGRVRTMRAAHISARPHALMTAGPLRDVTVVSGAVPGRARVNEQRAGMPAVGGMLHG